MMGMVKKRIRMECTAIALGLFLSPNDVFVNGQRVNGTVTLSPNANIRIGPYTIGLRGDELQIIDQGNQIRLDACDLVLETKGKRRIDDVSLAIEPEQLVALVGGSGAGKSTMMRTLLGTEVPTKGVVYLNGENLRTDFTLFEFDLVVAKT
jgi:ABC-type multidrug transport system fused ATPase/permease subunit